jgi:hypothetical protein
MKFSTANTKLKKLQKLTGKRVYSFGLLSGHTCPGAKDCLAMVIYDWAKDNYELKDGPDQKFRCYAASQEMQYTGVYNHRLGNWEAIDKLDSSQQIVNHLDKVFPVKAEIIRIHDAGDFFKKKYFYAWILLALRHPDVVFYAYTKMNPFWVEFRDQIPDNMILTASRGGKWDHLIKSHSLRESTVVEHEWQAREMGLSIDVDDSIASDPTRRNENFALMIHGQGPKGSDQAKLHYSRKVKNSR